MKTEKLTRMLQISFIFCVVGLITYYILFDDTIHINLSVYIMEKTAFNVLVLLIDLFILKSMREV